MLKKRMNGLLRPNFSRHRSLKLPIMGDRKKPIIGAIPQTRDILLKPIPNSSRIGDTKAVRAAYVNSIPITAIDILISSHIDFRL